MFKADEIEQVLWPAAEAWFTNKELLKLRELIQLARRGEKAEADLKRLEQTVEQERVEIVLTDPAALAH